MPAVGSHCARIARSWEMSSAQPRFAMVSASSAADWSPAPRSADRDTRPPETTAALAPKTLLSAAPAPAGAVGPEDGLLRIGHLVECDRAALVAGYAGQTAIKTKQMVDASLGGIMFVDEAYSLVQGEVELGRECINVLVDMAYAHRDALVVVLAGYEAGMADLFRSNAGLPWRFPHRFAFADYSAPELEAIAALMLESSGFEVADADAAAALG